MGQADISSWGVERVCPLGSALCGVRTKIFEGQTDSVSNLGLTDLMLQCCQLPSFISPPPPLAAPNRAPASPNRAPASPSSPNRAPPSSSGVQFRPPPRRASGGSVVFG